MDAYKLLYTALTVLGTMAIVNRVGALKALVVPKVDGAAKVGGAYLAGPAPVTPVPGVGDF